MQQMMYFIGILAGARLYASSQLEEARVAESLIRSLPTFIPATSIERCLTDRDKLFAALDAGGDLVAGSDGRRLFYLLRHEGKEMPVEENVVKDEMAGLLTSYRQGSELHYVLRKNQKVRTMREAITRLLL